MEWLVIIGLVVAVVRLWGRVGALEKQLHEIGPDELRSLARGTAFGRLCAPYVRAV